jgi:hypothetical protein
MKPTQHSIPTTIVGGRPSDTRQGARDIPRGLEVLLKKAAVDEDFRALVLTRRSRACDAIALALDPAEAAMLDSMPKEQLTAIIRSTRVPAEDRRVFLGKVASVMLAALGAGTSGCKERHTRGHTADRVDRAHTASAQSQQAQDPGETGGLI